MNYTKIYGKILLTFLQDINNNSKKTIILLRKFIQSLMQNDVTWDTTKKEEHFLCLCSKKISEELSSASNILKKDLNEINEVIEDARKNNISIMHDTPSFKKFRTALWNIFSKEAKMLNLSQDNEENRKYYIQSILSQRSISIQKLNPTPIHDPSKEILFTSNILLTIPKEHDIETLSLSKETKEKLYHIIKHEPQQYWYDHPMPIGISKKANELIYGLKGLAETLEFEKKNGIVSNDATLTILLSVSVTHPSLSEIAQEYIQTELSQLKDITDIKVYIATEKTTKEIASILSKIDTTLFNTSQIANVFGVDGRYGRHYSFLKAISVIWKLCMNSETKATFKIDLDQVFPEKTLLSETKKTAFQHFCTPLWGATALDNEGKLIELGMIAGALVNESDIHKGLFTPDVPLPPINTKIPVDIFFPRSLFMALSTRAEMMTRYTKESSHNGISSAIQRVHVTGGTNGILIDSLRKYRPFTPTFIGRAEDQAYILSVYNDTKKTPALRYIHASGLIMRHDKAAFAGEAIQSAKYGTYAGDLLRTLLFSKYSQYIPGGSQNFTKCFAPFTSCFASSLPICASIGRLILHAYQLSQNNDNDAYKHIEVAATTMSNTIETLHNTPSPIEQQYIYEKENWDMFYDAVEILYNAKTEKQSTLEPLIANIKTCLENSKIK